MIVDTSAVIALIHDETAARKVAGGLAAARAPTMGAPVSSRNPHRADSASWEESSVTGLSEHVYIARVRKRHPARFGIQHC
jgi:uncharacterized protein with PIN domain